MVEVFESLINQAPQTGLFKNVEIYNNHVDRLRLGLISYDTPSLFIEIKPTNSVNLSQEIDRMDLFIRFHIVMQQLDAGNGSLDQNFNIFYLRDVVNETYLSFTPTNCTSISYDRDMQQYNHTNLYHYVLFFKCHYTDLSAYAPIYIGNPWLVFGTADIAFGNCNVTFGEAFGPLLSLGIDVS